MSRFARSCAVVTDSTSDVPAQEAEELQLEVVPAVLTIDGQTYEDGRGLSRAEFYRKLPTLREPATTGAPSSEAFERVYRRLLSAGAERILSVHVAGTLSGILNSAHQAAQTFGERVTLFDSRQLSMGLGFQALEAARVARQGGAFEAVLGAAERARAKVRLVALIDTLEYMRRSGRVGWLRAGIGDLLKVKALVQVVEGVVHRIGEVRTKHRALDQLLELSRGWGPLDRLAVLHSGIPEEAESFAQRVRSFVDSAPIIVDVTTIIGTHIGPGSIGLAALVR